MGEHAARASGAVSQRILEFMKRDALQIASDDNYALLKQYLPANSEEDIETHPIIAALRAFVNNPTPKNMMNAHDWCEKGAKALTNPQAITPDTQAISSLNSLSASLRGFVRSVIQFQGFGLSQSL